MKLSDFDYHLPEGAIAQEPAEPRDAARLLVHDLAGAEPAVHARVRDLGRFLDPGDLLVVNDTRVLSARLFGRRGGGGRTEVLLLERLRGDPRAEAEERWRALCRPATRVRPGEPIEVEGGLRVVPLERLERGAFDVRIEAPRGEPVAEVLERVGRMPLPPYVRRAAEDERDALDRERYQTVYAREPGAVAAPTAGLHFTEELLAALAARGVERAHVTLHVGEGTFRPVEVEDVEAHPMHAERFAVPAETVAAVERCRARGGRVVAVGTTSVRALESATGPDGRLDRAVGETRLFLRPGDEFRVVDALLTNFHLPRSTLLMLVAAFAGRERTLALYREAIERGYRFYSYGDAMLLRRPGRRAGR